MAIAGSFICLQNKSKMIKPFIEINNKNYKYANKKVVKGKDEDERLFLKRLENESLLFRVVNNKENYKILRTFDEENNKQALFYIEVTQ